MPTQSRVWADTIVKANKSTDVSRLYRFTDGVEAVLPLFSNRFSPRYVSIMMSPPAAWGFGGTISTGPLSAAHISAIFDDCSRLPGAAVQIRPNPIHAKTWADAAEGTVWQSLARNSYVLNLACGFDEVWSNRFPGNTRNKIRKAEKMGVTVASGASDELVAAFDELFRRSIARWALRQKEFGWLAALRGRLRDPKRKFLSMARLSETVMRVSIAYLDGSPVAGVIVLMGKNAHYTRGAMDERLAGKTRANYLLQKLAIEFACQSGCRNYHMGETALGSSLASFKSSFGAEAIPYADYRYERIPLIRTNETLRALVKRGIGFQDA